MLLTRENTLQNFSNKMLSSGKYVTDDPKKARQYDRCVSTTKRLAKQAHHWRKHFAEPSSKEREKPNHLTSTSIWQNNKKKKFNHYIHIKKPIKAWGNMHCFQIRLNFPKIRSKKKKKKKKKREI